MRYFLMSVLSFSVSSLFWISTAAADVAPMAKPETKISVMAYNVENLFDTQHDENRDDWTYLPLAFKKANPDLMQKECEKMSTPFYKDECLNADWSEETLAIKMERVADVILQINGRGPDVLIVEEVENLRVLKQLNDRYLKAAGYQTVVLLEGEDERGIDIGILSRFPLAQPEKIHLIEFSAESGKPTTRGIMEAALKLPTGQTLFVLGFHFPSQSNPLSHRVDAVNTLNKIMQSKGAGALVIGAGDSNITAVEDQSAGLVSKTLAPLWSVSHLVGCKTCKGTHFYKGGWDYLDLMLFSGGLISQNSDVVMAPESIRTPTASKFQLTKNGTPARFDEASAIGVSDHLPIYGELTVKSK